MKDKEEVATSICVHGHNGHVSIIVITEGQTSSSIYIEVCPIAASYIEQSR